jgi:DNA-directed RNA polymerase I and III subunit RPAC2
LGQSTHANLRVDDAEANVFDVLRKGLNDLSDLCDVVEDKFTVARDEFNQQDPSREKS